MKDIHSLPPWIYMLGEVGVVSAHFINEVLECLRIIAAVAEHDVHLEQIADSNTTYFAGAQYNPADIHKSARRMVRKSLGKKLKAGDGAIHLFVDKHSPTNLAVHYARSLQRLARERGGRCLVLYMQKPKHEREAKSIPWYVMSKYGDILVSCTNADPWAVASNIADALLHVFMEHERLLLLKQRPLQPAFKEQNEFLDRVSCTLHESIKHPNSAKPGPAGLVASKRTVTWPVCIEWDLMDGSGSTRFTNKYGGEKSRAVSDHSQSFHLGEQIVPPTMPPQRCQTDQNDWVVIDELINLPTRGLAKTCEGLAKVFSLAAQASNSTGRKLRRVRRTAEDQQEDTKAMLEPTQALHQPGSGEKAFLQDGSGKDWEDDASTIAELIFDDG